MINLSILIPAFNEDAHIESVLKNIDETPLNLNKEDLEIIVIDDASTDKTFEIANQFVPKNFSLKVVKKNKNEGKGAAIKTGIQHSTRDWLLIQDADPELIPSDIPKLIEATTILNIRFVNGSRYLPGPVRPLYSYRRYFFNKLFSRMASVLINVRITDVACGYKLFSKELLHDIKLKENRFGFEAELLIKIARKKKTLITEVPVNYFPRNKGDGKKIRNADGVRIFWVIFKYGFLRFN